MTRGIVLSALTLCLAAVPASFALQTGNQGGTPPARPAAPPSRPAAPPAAPAKPDAAKPATPPAGAEPQMSEEAAKRMAAMMMAGAPGLEHQKMMARTGVWDLDVKFWMGAGAPEQSSKAEATITMILGGRFLEERVKGDFFGSPFEGIGITGYDNAAKQFVSLWIDNMITGFLESRGTASADGKTINFTNTMTNPETGKPENSRSVWTMVDPTTMRFESFDKGPDGKEFKAMEITYKRRGGVGTGAGTGGAAGGVGAPSRPAAPAAPSRPATPPTSR